MKSKKIINLLTPTASTDEATKGYIDTLDGHNVKSTGTQTMAGTKKFSGILATSLGVPCIVGRNSKGTGATGGLELYGTNNNMNGPHIQAFVNTSVYPVFQQLNWGQDNIALSFDCYYDGAGWKSSDPGSTFQIYKLSDKLAFNYKSGVALAGTIAFSEAINISNPGVITTTGAITASSLITANAGISSAQSITMSNSGSQIYFSDGTTATCGIRWSDDNHCVFCQRNANVMYIKEYGDIYFQTTGSTSRAHVNSSGFYVPSSGSSTSVQIGTRTGFPNEPMILMRSANIANNRGFFGFSGNNIYAWSTTNTNGEPSGYYNYIPTNGAWTYASDRRLKTYIKTLECGCGECSEKLMKLNCCSYYLKSDKKKESKNCGFIADEVKKIFPEFVTNSNMKIGENENLEGITSSNFIQILASAFQHVAEKVINLEKENKLLLNILQDQANELAEIRAVVFPNAP